MRGPPDPEMRRAASAQGSPQSQILHNTEESSLAASDFQARKLSRLYSFCQATACTVARLAFAVSR
jgi:hypothetical protein